jgi:spermidine/putrescine transport system ATP-binding protein
VLVSETSPGQFEGSEESDAPAVELRGLLKTFDGRPVVRGIDLSIRQGEFFTLLGPSGCGKTTTLRIIAGLEDASGGDVLLRGESVLATPPNRRPTNTVFQHYALFPNMTVADNVAFGLKRRKTPKAEIDSRVATELRRVGLADKATAQPNELSGGMQQRVALARALVNMPEVLLLDEPLGALDLKLRKQLQVELKQIQRQVGITFIYVTHDQEEALTMSDRIAIMNGGVVEQIGSPEDIYERPATTFVAGFIGVSNLLKATVRATSGGGLGATLDDGTDVPAAIPPALVAGDPCRVLIRPERIALEKVGSSVSASADVIRQRGRIVGASYLGTATQFQVDLSGDEHLIVLVPQSAAGADATFAVGEDVDVVWHVGHAHVLRESPATDQSD